MIGAIRAQVDECGTVTSFKRCGIYSMYTADNNALIFNR